MSDIVPVNLKSKYFIVSYTCNAKQYCDERFLGFLRRIKHPNIEINIVDNTRGIAYFQRLQAIAAGSDIKLHHIEVDDLHRFQRSVCESANYLRDLFLKTDFDYFMIIESDVFPPDNFIDLFSEVEDQGDIIGGLYYPGFHPVEWFAATHSEIVERFHVLSGCTLYSRRLIETIKFRWNPEDLRPFPDAYICWDAHNTYPEHKFRVIDYTKIKCRHVKS